jgi:hypothetical protein
VTGSVTGNLYRIVEASTLLAIPVGTIESLHNACLFGHQGRLCHGVGRPGSGSATTTPIVAVHYAGRLRVRTHGPISLRWAPSWLQARA